MAGQSPLRRWKPFFSAFGLVDAAIEAADPALRRDAIRSARGEVVELLCGVPAAGDGRKAEELCVALDGFMAESLLTLLAVPAEKVPSVLTSSADLPKAVEALRCHHQSARVRGLARDITRGWTAAVEGDVAKAKERFDAVHGVNKAAPNKLDAKRGSAEVEEKKMEAPEASRRSSLDVKKRESPEEKERMEATKRKLREGYREVEDAKRQRKIQVIAAPKMVEQRRREMHPILRERSRARCGTSSTTVVRRSLVSLFNRV
ncbi:unnamed protein product [Urochloa decumbens]|uniref:TFIIS N-terminal domain-containing protein n=1 Tax=Urochloa decumbens TaxID=240449 RepID=A0ABC8XVE2_9POAL